jgi:hypothetical protein
MEVGRELESGRIAGPQAEAGIMAKASNRIIIAGIAAAAVALGAAATALKATEVFGSSAPADAQKIDGQEPRFGGGGPNAGPFEAAHADDCRDEALEGLTVTNIRPQKGGDKGEEFAILEVHRPDLIDCAGYNTRNIEKVTLETRRSLSGDNNKFQHNWRVSRRSYSAKTLTGREGYKIKMDYGQNCQPGKKMENRVVQETSRINRIDSPELGWGNYGDKVSSTQKSRSETFNCPR